MPSYILFLPYLFTRLLVYVLAYFCAYLIMIRTRGLEKKKSTYTFIL